MATVTPAKQTTDVEGPTRLHVNMNKPTATALRTLAEKKGVNVTEAIRQAVGIWKFLDEIEEAGAKIQIVDKDGTISTVHIVNL